MTGAMTGATGQTIAARPALSVWVGASAGTGKTKVLGRSGAAAVAVRHRAGAHPVPDLHPGGGGGDGQPDFYQSWAPGRVPSRRALAGALTELLEAAPDAAMLERAGRCSWWRSTPRAG